MQEARQKGELGSASERVAAKKEKDKKRNGEEKRERGKERGERVNGWLG
jgi:hypothetical protein